MNIKDNKRRNQILRAFLENLSRIADKEYQERVWIKAEGPECHDFDDAACEFFQEGDSILEDYKSYNISNEQYQLLKKFRDEFDEFSGENSWPPEFISSPEWKRIMDMAKEVLKAFNYEKK